MLDRALIFLDLETTGATAHSDRITDAPAYARSTRRATWPCMFDAGIYKILVQYFRSSPRDSEIVALG